jgi:FkbM family methyltransferase
MRKFLYKKLRFARTLSFVEFFSLIPDCFTYLCSIYFDKLITIDDVSSYSIEIGNKKVKSPVFRTLKIMKTKFLTFESLRKNKDYFDALNINDGGLILDIGANIGYYSIIYSNVLPGSKVISFEPSSYNIPFLKYNLLYNKNVKICEYGLHDKIDSLYISMPTESQNLSLNKATNNTGLLSLYGESGKLKEKIDLFPLDKKIDQLNKDDLPIKFIKIDVEGNELNVLKGATNVISKHKPIIEIEMNKSCFDMAKVDPNDITDFFKELNYEPYEYIDSGFKKLNDVNSLSQNVVFLNNK